MWNVPHGKIPLVMWQLESSKVHMKIAYVATKKSDTPLIAWVESVFLLFKVHLKFCLKKFTTTHGVSPSIYKYTALVEYWQAHELLVQNFLYVLVINFLSIFFLKIKYFGWILELPKFF